MTAATDTARHHHEPHAAMVAARPAPTQPVGLLGEVSAARRYLDHILGAPDFADAAPWLLQTSAGDITYAHYHGVDSDLRAELVRLAAIALAWADTLDPHIPESDPATAGPGDGGPRAGDDIDPGGVSEFCEASGWAVRTACVDHHGRVHCPLCGRRVPAGPAGPRVVVIDLHEAARP